ncbi:MAG TPA: phage holin family protein [Thermoanaerobaculia bacterium]|nr:phage holin family protein [Thermoanaerobaculia bacterium]
MTDRPISEILKALGDDLRRLVREEVALLKAEMQENLTKIGTGAGLLGGAGVIGLFALLFVLLALMFGLSALGLQLWLAALLVGIGLAVIAGAMAMGGKKSVSSAHFSPAQTIEQVKTDAAVLKHDVEQMRRG